jgi:hypothetical protein
MAYSAVRLLKMLDGSPPVIANWPVATGQTIVAGDFVYRVSGYTTVCADDPQIIGGLALEGVTVSVAGARIDVLVITEMTMLQMCVHGVNPLDTIQAADHGKTWQIEKISTVWVINKDVATSPSIKIQEFIDALGTVNGKVGVVIPPGIREVA